MVVSELKMKIEMLESKLQMREEQIDSLKAELNRLNTFLMLERRSVFARLRDYLVVLHPLYCTHESEAFPSDEGAPLPLADLQ